MAVSNLFYHTNFNVQFPFNIYQQSIFRATTRIRRAKGQASETASNESITSSENKLTLNFSTVFDTTFILLKNMDKKTSTPNLDLLKRCSYLQ